MPYGTVEQVCMRGPTKRCESNASNRPDDAMQRKQLLARKVTNLLAKGRIEQEQDSSCTEQDSFQLSESNSKVQHNKQLSTLKLNQSKSSIKRNQNNYYPHIFVILCGDYMLTIASYRYIWITINQFIPDWGTEQSSWSGIYSKRFTYDAEDSFSPAHFSCGLYT